MAEKSTRVLPLVLLLVCAGAGRAGSLVGHWSFDDIQGTSVPDRSGSGNNGTINGAPLTIDGPFGKALQLNGVTDFVDVGNAPSLNITARLTLSVWVKTVDAGEPAAGQQAGQNQYLSKHNSYQIKHRTNLLIFAIWDGGCAVRDPHLDRQFLQQRMAPRCRHV